MDPDEALGLVGSAADEDELTDYTQNLYNWLKMGGFSPNWKKQPAATKRYRARLKKGDIW